MTVFGWIAEGREPPLRWDLRPRGWTLCRRPAPQRSACTHPLLIDARPLGRHSRLALVESHARPAIEAVGEAVASPSAGLGRLILLGVDDSAERAALLARGCAEALPEATDLCELEARTRRVAERAGMLPRARPVGPLLLDLFHRDARLGSSWLNLHPREFGLLWRLADAAGGRVTRRELLRDVWRIHHEPETNSVEVHVSRLRSKLAGVGCEALVETAIEGGYRLAAGASCAIPADVPHRCSPDRHLHRPAFSPIAGAESDRP